MRQRLRMELRRSIFTWQFLFGVIVTFLLLLQANYTSLMQMTDDLRWQYSNISFFGIALNFSYLPIAAAAIAAITYSYSCCDEIRSGFFVYSMLRGTKRQYIAAKYLATGIAGGLVLALGVFLYGLFISCITPSIDPSIAEHRLPYDGTFWRGIYMQNGGIPFIALMSLQYFLYGFIFSNLGMALSSIVKNKYIALTSPFIVAYMALYIAQKLGIAFLDPSEILVQATYSNAPLGLGVFEFALILLVGFLFYRRITKGELQ